MPTCFKKYKYYNVFSNYENSFANSFERTQAFS